MAPRPRSNVHTYLSFRSGELGFLLDIPSLRGCQRKSILKSSPLPFNRGEEIVALITDLLAKLRRFPVLLKRSFPGMTPHPSFLPSGEKGRLREDFGVMTTEGERLQ